MTAMQELGISREDILDKAAEKLLENISVKDDLAYSIKEKVSRQLVDAAKEKIDGLLQEAVDDLVDTEFTPVDEWGEPMRKSPTSLRRMVKDRAMSFLTERVNKDGKACTYQAVGSRGEWMAEKAAKDAMTFEVKKELTKAVESAKSELQKRVADHITETLLNR